MYSDLVPKDTVYVMSNPLGKGFLGYAQDKFAEDMMLILSPSQTLENATAWAHNFTQTLGKVDMMTAYTMLAGQFTGEKFAAAWKLYCAQYLKGEVSPEAYEAAMNLVNTAPPAAVSAIDAATFKFWKPSSAQESFLLNEVQAKLQAAVATPFVPKDSGIPKVYHAKGKDDWGTPWDFFLWLDAMFHFTLDVCATADNAKCIDYLTPEMNALNINWWGRVFMNPPYSKAAKWMERLAAAAHTGEIELGVALVAARVDTEWWWNALLPASEVWFLKGRLKFEGEASNWSHGGAPFPSAIFVYRPDASGRQIKWVDWKNSPEGVWVLDTL